MKRTWLAILMTVGLVATSGIMTIRAQQAPADHKGHDEAAEIFCPMMKTGQLCDHGTADALQLTGEKADRWKAAVKKYNDSVEQATKALEGDAKTLLTADQTKELDRWFARGLNPEINKLLQNPVAKPATK
jgi:hypothetical protein